MQIDADFKQKMWNIDAEGSGDAYFEQILWNVDAEVLVDTYSK